jgi:hypothetical protein
MDIAQKRIQADVEPVASDHPNGEFDVILSTDVLDRDGERLYLDEWKQPLPDHITFDTDHDMTVASTAGSGKPFINDAGQVQVRGVFASTPHGQTVRALVNEGHIKHVSVAFKRSKTQKDAKPERELLNAGFVVNPANPEAVVLASKAAKDDVADSKTLAVNLAKLVLKALSNGPGAPSVYDDGYDETGTGGDTDNDPGSEPDKDEDDSNDSAQAVHDAAVALGAECASKTYHGNVVSLHEKAAAKAADPATEQVPGLPAVTPADLAARARVRKFRFDQTSYIEG